MAFTQNDLKPNRCIITNYFDFLPLTFDMIETNNNVPFFRGDMFPQDYNTFVIVYSDDDYTLLSDNTPVRKGYYNGKETHYMNGYIIKTKTLLKQLNRPKWCISQLVNGVPNVSTVSNKQYLNFDKNINPKDMSFIEYNNYRKKYIINYNMFDKNGIKSDTEFNEFLEKYNKIAAGKYAHWKNQLKYEQKQNGNGFYFLEERYPDETENQTTNKPNNLNTKINTETNEHSGNLNKNTYNNIVTTIPKNAERKSKYDGYGYYGSLLDPPTK